MMILCPSTWKYGLVPIVITPYGMFGNNFDRFLFGAGSLPLPDYSKPHALQAAKTAILPDVPFGVLQRANTIWRSKNAGNKLTGAIIRRWTPCPRQPSGWAV